VSKTKVKSYVKKDGTKVRAHSKKNGWAIYPNDRRTPILVDGNLRKDQAIKKALSIKKRGSNQIDLVRRLTDKEQIKADKGEWVRGYNIDKARKKLRGVGPKPIGFNHNLNLILFAKHFRGLKKEQLEKLVKVGKNWAKRNRLSISKYPELISHDIIHTAGEQLRPKYRLAPLSPKFVKNYKKRNPSTPQYLLEQKAKTSLTNSKNIEVENYITGLEGTKQSSSTSRAYWLGRRDRKKNLPKDYKILQRQIKLENLDLSYIKPDPEIKPVGGFKTTKSHTRKLKTGKITRIRTYKSKD